MLNTATEEAELQLSVFNSWRCLKLQSDNLSTENSKTVASYFMPMLLSNGVSSKQVFISLVQLTALLCVLSRTCLYKGTKRTDPIPTYQITSIQIAGSDKPLKRIKIYKPIQLVLATVKGSLESLNTYQADLLF